MRRQLVRDQQQLVDSACKSEDHNQNGKHSHDHDNHHHNRCLLFHSNGADNRCMFLGSEKILPCKYHSSERAQIASATTVKGLNKFNGMIPEDTLKPTICDYAKYKVNDQQRGQGSAQCIRFGLDQLEEEARDKLLAHASALRQTDQIQQRFQYDNFHRSKVRFDAIERNCAALGDNWALEKAHGYDGLFVGADFAGCRLSKSPAAARLKSSSSSVDRHQTGKSVNHHQGSSIDNKPQREHDHRPWRQYNEHYLNVRSGEDPSNVKCCDYYDSAIASHSTRFTNTSKHHQTMNANEDNYRCQLEYNHRDHPNYNDHHSQPHGRDCCYCCTDMMFGCTLVNDDSAIGKSRMYDKQQQTNAKRAIMRRHHDLNNPSCENQHYANTKSTSSSLDSSNSLPALSGKDIVQASAGQKNLQRDLERKRNVRLGDLSARKLCQLAREEEQLNKNAKDTTEFQRPTNIDNHDPYSAQSPPGCKSGLDATIKLKQSRVCDSGAQLQRGLQSKEAPESGREPATANETNEQQEQETVDFANGRVVAKDNDKPLSSQDKQQVFEKLVKTTRNSLPASLKRIGRDLLTGQELISNDELIKQFQDLDKSEKQRLDENRKLYKPMNWKHIANIYKQQTAAKSKPKNNKRTICRPITNSNNNQKNIIINPMYPNKCSKHANSTITSGANANHPPDSNKCRNNNNQSDQSDANRRSGNNNYGVDAFRYFTNQDDTHQARDISGVQMDYVGDSVCSKLKHSCLCQMMVNILHNLFPIIHAFDDFSMPGDLISDLFTGLTIGVMQVPQGMAYGMLAGIDPIYGLYVSLVPVLMMAFLSKSRHVSYGTFAIISILLSSSTESIRTKIKLSQTTRSLITSGYDEQQIGEQNLNQASRIGSLAANPPINLRDPSGASLSIDKNQQIVVPLQIINQLMTANEVYQADQSSSIISDMQQQQQQQQQYQALINPTNIEILTTICITVGIIQIMMSFLRLGHLSVIFSDQLVSSFTCASSIHVLTSQVAGLFDLDTPSVPEGLFKVCRTWWQVLKSLVYTDSANGPNGLIIRPNYNYYTAILSLISILFLLIVKEFVEPWLRSRYKMIKCLPTELILMSCIITSSWYWQFNASFNMKIVGDIPTGFPEPKLPPLELIPFTIQDALTIALISFAMNLSLAQVYAKQHRYKIDSNQELFAVGASNFVGSFFNCFPCASSLSRSAMQSNLNVRSPLAPIFSCAIVLSIICYFAPIVHYLPKSTLSCIIIIALKGVVMQCRDLTENWRLSKLDALTWLATFWAVIAFGVTYGLIIGILSSLLTVFFRILTPNYSILGQLPGTDIYVDKSAFGDCDEIEQVRIFRFNSPLCYMNRTMFRARVESALPSIYKKFDYMHFFCPKRRQFEAGLGDRSGRMKSADRSISKNNKGRVRFFIIDCSALAYCDHSGASLLIDLINELEEHKVTVYLAACPIKLVIMIERIGPASILETNVYPTIKSAVNQAVYLRDTSNCDDNPSVPSTIYCLN